MRKAQPVQAVKCFLDFGIYPRFLAIRCFRGTNCDHVGKGRIGADPETVGPDGFAEGARHLEIIERYDRPRFRFHPESVRIITRIRHREYARSISFQQQVEINGHEYQITLSAPFGQLESGTDCDPSRGHQYPGLVSNFLRNCRIFAGEAGIGAPGGTNAAGYRPAFDIKQRDITTA